MPQGYFFKFTQPPLKTQMVHLSKVVTHACMVDVSTLEWRQWMRYTQILFEQFFDSVTIFILVIFQDF